MLDSKGDLHLVNQPMKRASQQALQLASRRHLVIRPSEHRRIQANGESRLASAQPANRRGAARSTTPWYRTLILMSPRNGTTTGTCGLGHCPKESAALKGPEIRIPSALGSMKREARVTSVLASMVDPPLPASWLGETHCHCRCHPEHHRPISRGLFLFSLSSLPVSSHCPP